MSSKHKSSNRRLTSLRHFINGRSPGQLVIQLTDQCNATCPQCAMRVANQFQRTSLAQSSCEALIDQAARLNIQAISFTGGEPLLHLAQLAAIVAKAGEAGLKYTRTGTNGFLFRNHEAPGFIDLVKRTAETLAKVPLRNFWISIDSADPQTHEHMRGFPGVVRGIEKALPIFHEFGLYPTANLGLSRNLGGNKISKLTTGVHDVGEIEEFIDDVSTGVSSFLDFVVGMGFSIVNFCYPMSINRAADINAVYAAASPDRIVSFSTLEKWGLFSAMLETIPRFRAKLRIFSPLSSLYSLQQSYAPTSTACNFKPFPCRGGLDYFFISATDGKAYPCGYRGDECLGELHQIWDACRHDSNCTKCDWECFRDPSELFGPLLHGLRSPLQLFTSYRRDWSFYRLWLNDLRYYRACDLFDGRKPLDHRKLTQFTADSARGQAFLSRSRSAPTSATV